ncbi:probable nuclear transport factor 2 isoform X1 [Drosophila pseudoobscura]|uniref:Probable nuclear transport factor 2 isoform X1 n=2 Tax=Drosophila pseudoobscura pseudoobscura TaxID=46245 RepID=A0A6I8V8K1_DROPS|nr:probable nuclear transport factor 2 isoform X1 [Drosophila pseudoobscura]
MSLNLQFENIANSFVQEYYTLLDSPENRTRVAHFYKTSCRLLQQLLSCLADAVLCDLDEKITQCKRTDRYVYTCFAKESLMTVEGLRLEGASQILQTIQNLSFKKIHHMITVVDAQPTIDGGVLICVMGRLKIDDGSPFSFSQVFVLKAVGNSFFVENEIFRLSELKSP